LKRDKDRNLADKIKKYAKRANMKIKILWQKSSDGSQVEFTRAYEDLERAEQDFQLVKDDKSRIWRITEIDLIEDEEGMTKEKLNRYLIHIAKKQQEEGKL